MPRKKTTTDEKLIGLTVRIPEQDHKIFQALLALNGESANDVLRKTVMDYIKKHQRKINMEELDK